MGDQNLPAFEEIVGECRGFEKNTKKSAKYVSPSRGKIETSRLHFDDIAYQDLLFEIKKAEKIIAARSFDKNIIEEPLEMEKPKDSLAIALERVQKAKLGIKPPEFKLELPDVKKIKKLLVRPALKREDKIKPKKKPEIFDKTGKGKICIADIDKLEDQVLIDYAREYYKGMYDSFSMGVTEPEGFRVTMKQMIARDHGIPEDVIVKHFGSVSISPFEEFRAVSKGG